MGRMESGVKRNEKGQIVKGSKALNPNPTGRPVGAVSIISALKRRLKEEVDVKCEGSKFIRKTRADILAEKVLDKATEEGDGAMMRYLIDQLDGKAKESIDHTSGGEPITSINYIKPKSDGGDDSKPND